MAVTVDITVDGSPLSGAGRQYWATEATVTEDATGVHLVDTFGGVGSLQVSTDLLDDTMAKHGDALTATYSSGGTRTATIQGISEQDGLVTIDGATALQRLNRFIKVKPQTTTLGAALIAVFTACGIGSSSYSIDAGIAARTMLMPGWQGNAWDNLKELAAIERFEIADVASVVTVRPIGAITLDFTNRQTLTRTLGENVAGKQVETHFYQYRQITNGLIYPPASYDDDTGATTAAGWTADAQVIEVTPGSPVIIDVPVLASLTSVQQPVCIKTAIGPDYDGASAYNVLTKDGVEPIDPKPWTDRGGKITVSILPDTSTIRITVDAGWNVPDAGPYRIAVASDTDYSTLRINGTGIQWQKYRLRQPTSIPDNLTDTDIASSTDSPFCRTETQARQALMAQAAAASRSIVGLSGTLADLPQPIGQRAGGLIKRPEAVYRVRTATTNSQSVALEADQFTTVKDHKAATAGMTVAQAKALWAGQSIRQHVETPLGSMA